MPCFVLNGLLSGPFPRVFPVYGIEGREFRIDEKKLNFFLAQQGFPFFQHLDVDLQLLPPVQAPLVNLAGVKLERDITQGPFQENKLVPIRNLMPLKSCWGVIWALPGLEAYSSSIGK